MISVLTYLIALLAVPSQADLGTKSVAEDPKEIEWKKTSHDFGDIIAGTKAKYTFTFINKGNVAIVISNATASCGCTVPSYSKEPIAPGGQGSVTAIFDSSGKKGLFTKNITVTTNVGSSTLYIKGNVTEEQVKPKSPVQIGD
jgi:hypothetical protein